MEDRCYSFRAGIKVFKANFFEHMNIHIEIIMIVTHGMLLQPMKIPIMTPFCLGRRLRELDLSSC